MGQGTILAKLGDALAAAGMKLPRFACKMATGSGKTVVMAMVIAWHTLNKADNPHDKRFPDCFPVVAPGITIRDRLRVLQRRERNHDDLVLAVAGTAWVGEQNLPDTVH